MHKIICFAKRYRDVVTYVVFGLLTTAVNYGVFVLSCEWLKMSATISNIVAWVVAVLFAFLTNKPFVFKSTNWSREVVIPEFVKFVTCRIGSGFMETAFLFVTVDCMNWNGNIVKLIASGLVMVLNYISGKWVAFKRRK